MTALEALQEVLRTEHAAVYGYGVIAAQTSGPQRRAALNGLDTHRARRDHVRAMVVAAQGTPVEAAPAYRLPAPVRTPQAAARLAADTERELAVGPRGAGGGRAPGGPRVRRHCLAGHRGPGDLLARDPAGPARPSRTACSEREPDPERLTSRCQQFL